MNNAPTLIPPTEEQMRGVSHVSSFQLYQLIRYLFHTENGERGDVISVVCRIRNPSDLACKHKGIIAKMGLSLECILIKNTVKVGNVERKGFIGCWHLSIIDQDKWDSVGAKCRASNDSTF
jgi:hypothetical protein